MARALSVGLGSVGWGGQAGVGKHAGLRVEVGTGVGLAGVSLRCVVPAGLSVRRDSTDAATREEERNHARE